MRNDASNKPLAVIPVQGAVIVANPVGSGIVAITPSAAFASAEALVTAAHRALSSDAPPLDDER